MAQAGGAGLSPEARAIYVDLLKLFEDRRQRPETRKMSHEAAKARVGTYSGLGLTQQDSALMQVLSAADFVNANAILETVAAYLADRDKN